MRVHADFSERVLIPGGTGTWTPSPQAGVERIMLDRIGAEKARATSLVRYAPQSVFPAHSHPGGEEILVLYGVFSDETADFPAGWYMRNPPGSSHRPSSAQGAVIFVKLWQMSEDEIEPVRIDTRQEDIWTPCTFGAECVLFANATERVVLARVKAGATFEPDASSGAEMLLVSGSVSVGDAGHSRVLEQGTWWRLPPGDRYAVRGCGTDAVLYVKTGHLGKVMGEALLPAIRFEA